MPNLLAVLLASLPIAIVLVLMVGLRRSAALAGSVGLAACVLLAATAFPPEIDGVPGLWRPLMGAGAEASFTAATILWIIFGALCLYNLQLRTGALATLRAAIGGLSEDPRIIAILIGWFFALFAEGAAGFGTAIALAAPFLVGFGFPAASAVAIALIGHAAGVSFGAVGTPIVTQAQIAPFPPAALGLAAASYHVVFGWVMILALLRVTTAAFPDLTPRRMWPWVALAGAGFLVPMYLIARFVGPELPTMAGSLVGAGLFVAVYARAGGREAERTSQAEDEAAGDDERGERAIAMARAAAPYLIVIALVLITRLVPAARDALGSVRWTWALWGHFDGEFQPLLHPGTLLLVGFGLGAAAQGASRAQVIDAMADALRRLGPVAIALLTLLGLSRVMVHAGMIDALAAATAAVAGPAWPFVSPWVGVLGGFITGSGTASNILFTEFQASTTAALDMPVVVLLGAQSFGGAVGNMISPHNIVAGGATVGIAGEEGAILRRTLPACIVYATLGGILALLYVYG